MADNLTREQRSYCMSRVRSADTGPERAIRSALHKRGLRFRKHAKDLPGRPDLVFRSARVAVFIDGAFWHGYRLPAWEHTLSDFWQRKIARNRQRDQKNFQRLRRMGWTVIRIWDHQLRHDIEECAARIKGVVAAQGNQKAAWRARNP